MYSKQIVQKITALLTNNINKKPIVVCQEAFIKNIPKPIFNKIITIVVAENIASASSLRNFLHFEGMQQENIDIIEEEQFRQFNPNFDYIFVDSESKNFYKFIGWIEKCAKFHDIKICLICRKSLCKLLFNIVNPNWTKYYDNWMQTELIFKRNSKKEQSNGKFFDECIIEDDYGKIL